MLKQSATWFAVFLGFSLYAAAAKKMGPQPDKIEISSERLKTHVVTLALKPARSVAHPKQVEKAAVYIEEQFKDAGYQTRSQAYPAGGTTYRNIIAVLNPEKKKIIVVGAHYDVCGEQAGADDNASGVAGLIELARVLKSSAAEVPYQIQFVAFSTEEPPYFRTIQMGSYIHAKSLSDEKITPELMISLEMIGFFTDKKKSQDYPWGPLKLFYPSTGNFIGIVSQFGHRGYLKGLRRAMLDSGMPARTLAAPSFLQGVDYSDHMNYWKFGFKAVMVTDTSFFRNANYHEATDTPDTLDYTRMAKVVSGLARYLTSDGK